MVSLFIIKFVSFAFTAEGQAMQHVQIAKVNDRPCLQAHEELEVEGPAQDEDHSDRDDRGARLKCCIPYKTPWPPSSSLETKDKARQTQPYSPDFRT